MAVPRCLLVVLLVTVGVCCASKPARIVGGAAASIENYPAIVQVESSTTIFWSQSCAATILTSRFVLSAAQCFSGVLFAVSRRRIRAGTARRGRGGVVIGVTRVLNHPTYSSSTFDGDVSVVELSSALVYNPNIQPGSILAQDFVLPDHLPVVQAGWGSTTVNGGGTSDLRDVEVYTVNSELCAERYATLASPRAVTSNMLCTGVLGAGGQDACNGDEGGPVYYDNILVGVVSWRHACGNDTVPSVNTRVASYTNWIVINAL